MGKVSKLILVTSDGHPQHKYFKKITERLANELGVEIEVKKDDYVFLTEHGETDDLGLTWLPQLFAELDDGKIVRLLTQPKLNEKGKFDEEAGYKEAFNKVQGL